MVIINRTKSIERLLIFISIFLFNGYAIANRTFPANNITNRPTATPQITTTTTAGYITSCQGTASADPDIEQFTISGSNLLGDITTTAPVNFEISLNSGSGYSNKILLSAPGGTLNSTTIYVRSAAAAPMGKIYGNVVLSSLGVTDVQVSVLGTVNIVPTVSTTVPSQEQVTGSSTSPLIFTGPADIFNWTNDNPSIGLAASGTGNILSFTAVNGGSTPVTANITVTPQLISYAYIGNHDDNSISIINTATNTVVKTLTRIDHAPTGSVVSQDGTKVYLTNGYDNQGMSVIDPVTNTQVLATGIGKLASAPIGIAVSPDGKKVYVADSGLHDIYAFEPVNGTIISIYAVSGNPVTITITADGTKLFVTNSIGGMSVINTVNGNVAAINAANNTYGSCISPDGNLLYVTVPGNNAVSVYNIAANAVVATIPVGTNPEGINISPNGKILYVTNNGSANVSVISTLINQVVATVAVGLSPYGICPTSDGKFIYVTNQGSNSVSVINAASNTVITTIPVGRAPSSLGNFIIPVSICPGQPSIFTIKVDPKPSPIILTSIISGDIMACEGSASADPNIAQATVSGQNLTGPINVTAPANFEISFNPTTGYGNQISLAQSGGTTNNVIYIRSAAGAPSGNISGDLMLASSGATNLNLPVSAIITPLPVVDKVGDQSVSSGNTTTAINFTGTASVFNWTNNMPSIGLPASGFGGIASFTVINNTNSLVSAKITVIPVPSASNGNTIKCEGTPITFTITVKPSSNTSVTQNLAIPNTFTPNGDGVNDTWEIKALGNYPNCMVAIYNRWGEKLYTSVGYPVPWDGIYKGASLPVGTYYYLIDLKSGYDIISGWVAIVK